MTASYAAVPPVGLTFSSALPHDLGPAGPRRHDLGPVVERHHEILVFVLQHFEQEALDRRARVLDAGAEHAVARVDEDAEADRDAFARELRDGLRIAVFEELEVLAGQAADEPALGVADRRD